MVNAVDRAIVELEIAIDAKNTAAIKVARHKLEEAIAEEETDWTVARVKKAAKLLEEQYIKASKLRTEIKKVKADLKKTGISDADIFFVSLGLVKDDEGNWSLDPFKLREDIISEFDSGMGLG